MDLNYLFHRQQVADFRADNAACEPSRDAHRLMADVYAARIAAASSGNVVLAW